MKNCIILGSGRSGTSMVAGTLSGAGYYLGDTLLPPTAANPKGYFESREVEEVNEQLVRSMLYPTRWERLLKPLHPPPQQPNFDVLPSGSRGRWLALVPHWRRPYAKPRHLDAMRALVEHAPYCFKDPRFAYTLYAWRSVLKATVYICVFRDPAVTAASVLKEINAADYLNGLNMRLDGVLQMWVYVYQHILRHHRHEGEWLFLHYNQVLTSAGLDRIEALTGAQIDRQFPDHALTHARPLQAAPPHAQRLYRQLCALAGYQEV